MGTFESKHFVPHSSLVDPLPAAGHHSDESSVSSYSTSPSDILSVSGFSQHLLYSDATTYNTFMLSPASSTQRQGSTSSSSLSTDSSAYEPYRNQRRNDYDFRTRVNSQTLFAHPVTTDLNAGIHQDAIMRNNSTFYFSEHPHLSPPSSSASARSSPLDTFFLPTSYVPSVSVTRRLEDEGLQVQTYAGDMGASAHNSFPCYTLADGMGADATFNPFNYDTTHQK